MTTSRCKTWGIRLTWLVCSTALIPALGAPGADPKPKDPKAGQDDPKKLGERLIREVAQNEDHDVMNEVMRLMATAAKRLEIDFDAGVTTRSVQAEAMKQLDEAIKLAAANRRPVRSRQNQSQGDRRTRSQDQSGKKMSKQPTTSTDKAGESSPGDAKQPPVEGKQGGALRETRRAWGHLPQRDREELIQGAEDEFLERYREWIERYYRALQESDE